MRVGDGKVTAFHMPPEEHLELRAYALSKGYISLAEFLRQLVRRELEANKGAV